MEETPSPVARPVPTAPPAGAQPASQPASTGDCALMSRDLCLSSLHLIQHHSSQRQALQCCVMSILSYAVSQGRSVM